MYEVTNLHWPKSPFGASQRPFGRPVPMLAAVDMDWTGYWGQTCPAWTCAVFLRISDRQNLSLDGHAFNAGFVLNLQDAPGENLAPAFDDCLVAARTQARILAGHDLGTELGLFEGLNEERRLPGVDAVRQQWTDRPTRKKSDRAALFDTAHDPECAHDFNATCERLRITGVESRDSSTADASHRSSVARTALKQTFAVALIAAACTSKYTWTETLDLDEIVTEIAWDALADLDDCT